MHRDLALRLTKVAIVRSNHIVAELLRIFLHFIGVVFSKAQTHLKMAMSLLGLTLTFL